MCGIAGFVDRRADLGTLTAMTDAIANRGPDDAGHWLEDGVGLGHRRLSILDLSPLGHQPMRFEQLVLVFNGEIYNFAEVARDLEARGYTFRSGCDSEVLIKAFHCWGVDCVVRFIGMFAFAIWDMRERTLYLVRDRAGVKPLYYYQDGETLAFGSTLKALRPCLAPADRDRIDPAALSDFLALGYVGPGRSILAAVRKLPQAHYLTFKAGVVSLHHYWDVRFAPDPVLAGRPLDAIVDALEELAVSAFRYRMVADVPVGVFLSAGVDSSLVTAILARHHGRLHTFTVGFEEREADESGDAAAIAAHLGTVHTARVLTADEGWRILDRYDDIFDEPHGDSSGIATAFVSQVAKEAGMKVVLSADGGDELFGGYTRYLEFLARWEQVQRLGGPGRIAAGAALAGLGRLLPGFRGETLRRQAGLLATQPFLAFMLRRLAMASAGDLKRLYPDYRESPAAPGEGDLVAQMTGWDFANYMVDDVLVKVDRATMYHSLEGREPLLDHRLVEFAARLPSEYKVAGGRTKIALKALLGRYLPEPLWNLPKRGFGPPIVAWVRDHYREQIGGVLECSTGLFDDRAMRGLLERYRRGDAVNYPLIWYLYTFQRWHDRWTART